MGLFDIYQKENSTTQSESLIDKYSNSSNSNSNSIFSNTNTTPNDNSHSSLFDSSPDSMNSIFSSSNNSGNNIYNDETKNLSSIGNYGQEDFFNQNSIANTFNIRGRNYQELSLVDKMRGIQANRLNIDTEDLSMAEIYADKTLDNRTMNGLYNVTITDTYQDKKLFNAYHNLYTDGIITNIEDTQDTETYSTNYQNIEETNPLFIQNETSYSKLKETEPVNQDDMEAESAIFNNINKNNNNHFNTPTNTDKKEDGDEKEFYIERISSKLKETESVNQNKKSDKIENNNYTFNQPIVQTYNDFSLKNNTINNNKNSSNKTFPNTTFKTKYTKNSISGNNNNDLMITRSIEYASIAKINFTDSKSFEKDLEKIQKEKKENLEKIFKKTKIKIEFLDKAQLNNILETLKEKKKELKAQNNIINYLKIEAKINAITEYLELD